MHDLVSVKEEHGLYEYRLPALSGPTSLNLQTEPSATGTTLCIFCCSITRNIAMDDSVSSRRTLNLSDIFSSPTVSLLREE